ncbi:hypothetical protein [Parvularcula sp. LCG005]|uniref:hypothetical protein n=1 Tax=Parvularcula sp. LCG005 TaxID=3078805 RepID=UPI002942A824|nr:hypothetical protein [Parvularcula sp. LCG005]WOI52919.1 hypothetical protein RUI03_12250 [Parvularcula sp. LCG005]
MTVENLKPRLALRVGVTGHRQGRLDEADTGAIRSQIQNVLSRTAAVCENLARTNTCYDDQPPLLYFVSPVADGTDAMAAEVALELGYKLLVPLPFSAAKVAQSFPDATRPRFDRLIARADSVLELVPHASDGQAEDEAYLEAGLATLRHADVMISVWDGEAARGLGGTEMIVEAARDDGVPVVWIPLKTPDDVVILDGADRTPYSDDGYEALLDALLVLQTDGQASPDAADRFSSFLQEEKGGGWTPSFHSFVDKVLVGKWGKSRQHKPSAADNSLPHKDTEKTGAAAMVDHRYQHADEAAVRYGNVYRSSYYSNYFLSAAAVFLALLEVGLGMGKTLWISLELAVIVVILMTTVRGRKGRWHEKWLDYRQLTESLRRYVSVFAAGGALPFAHDEGHDRQRSGETDWTRWYFRATVRELGMTGASLTPAFKRDLIQEVIDKEIRPQIDYHTRNESNKHHLGHRLHKLGEYAFYGTLAVCVGYLLLVVLSKQEWAHWAYELKKAVKGWVTVLTGFLPAFGAALFGIRVQGELGAIAKRSASMASELRQTEAALQRLLEQDDPDVGDMRRLIVRATSIALSENAGWRSVYQYKPLDLPG